MLLHKRHLEDARKEGRLVKLLLLFVKFVPLINWYQTSLFPCRKIIFRVPIGENSLFYRLGDRTCRLVLFSLHCCGCLGFVALCDQCSVILLGDQTSIIPQLHFNMASHLLVLVVLMQILLIIVNLY